MDNRMQNYVLQISVLSRVLYLDSRKYHIPDDHLNYQALLNNKRHIDNIVYTL